MLFVPRGPGTEKAALPRGIQFGLRVLYSKAARGGNFEKNVIKFIKNIHLCVKIVITILLMTHHLPTSKI
jgi:K+-transporting ATPase A subunit